VRRKRLRLREYDYSANGAYFITICSHDRRALFVGEAEADVESELSGIATRFSGATVDEHVVMTDHIHVILVLSDCRSTIPRIIQAFKSLATARLRKRGIVGRIWQRGYYDRIVRNEMELMALREYIRDNPLAEEIGG